MLLNYFKTAFRNLQRNKVYAGINILGLSFGLACAMLIILYVKDELSFDRFHEKSADLYRIVFTQIDSEAGVEENNGVTGVVHGPRFTRSIPEIKAFVRMYNSPRDMKSGTSIVSQNVYFADSTFFNLFDFPFLAGNKTTALSHPNSVIITADFARKQFNSTDVLGKIMQIKDIRGQFQPYSITAVLKECPQQSSLKFNVLMPLFVNAQDEANNNNWFNFYLNTFVWLQPGANPAVVQSKMQQFYEADASEVIKKEAETYYNRSAVHYQLQPLLQLHLSKQFPAGNGLSDASNPMYSYLLSAIALFILVIACINFVNLTVARSLKRAREIGIRKVIGGSRKQVLLQFLGESMLLCLLSFLLALVLVKASLPVFNQLSNKALALNYLFDSNLVLGYLFLFLLTGFLAGFYPSMVLSAFNPVKVLYNRFGLSNRNLLQRGLVLLQFSLAGFLIVGTIIVYAQFSFLTTQNLGYNDRNLINLSFRTGPENRLETERLRNALLTNPDITSVSYKNRGNWSTAARVNGTQDIAFAYETVDAAFFKNMGISLAAGRYFSDDFPADSTASVIVNETFVRRAGWKDPIGEEVNFFYWKGARFKVVGVVKDYHFESLNTAIEPQLFTLNPRNDFGKAYIRIQPGAEKNSLAHIEKVYKAQFPDFPFSYAFTEQQNQQRYRAEARWKNIMLLGALLTLFISCIGLFGLSVLAAERRTREIGVRKVLGASVTGIASMLSVDFLKLVLVSFVIAMPMAWITASKWLQNYPYRVSISWWMFALAAMLVSLLALLTVGFHSLRAALRNPVKSLRAS